MKRIVIGVLAAPDAYTLVVDGAQIAVRATMSEDPGGEVGQVFSRIDNFSIKADFRASMLAVTNL